VVRRKQIKDALVSGNVPRHVSDQLAEEFCISSFVFVHIEQKAAGLLNC
jgi:hypothetical protein